MLNTCTYCTILQLLLKEFLVFVFVHFFIDRSLKAVAWSCYFPFTDEFWLAK